MTNCSNNFSPRQHPEKLIPHMTLHALAGETLPMYGTGANVRDWLHVEDHARGLVDAAMHGAPGATDLFGGNAERTNLHPATRAISKQQLPVCDKPMVHYPLSVLMLAGIRKVRLISTPHAVPLFRRLLGDGNDWGMRLAYPEQPSPDGLAQALIIAEEFLDGRPSTLVPGDNLFFGYGFSERPQRADARTQGATVFGCRVQDPERYGVVAYGPDGRATDLVEKPQHPPSGFASLDTGTLQSLLQAATFVETVEQRQGVKIGAPEEIAWRNRWIDDDQLRALAEPLAKTEYGRFQLRLVEGAG